MNIKNIQSIVMDKVASLDVGANVKNVKKAVDSLDDKLPEKLLTKSDVQREQLIVAGVAIVTVGVIAGMSLALLKKCNCSKKCSCACGGKKKKHARGKNNLNSYKHHMERKY